MLSNFYIKLSTKFFLKKPKPNKNNPPFFLGHFSFLYYRYLRTHEKCFHVAHNFEGIWDRTRYVIITLKTTSTIAIWSYVLLHTQNNIFYIEAENRNKHLPGWSLLQSVWMNLNNYILQQNILASGKLFTKICSRAHANKWSQGLPLQNFFC